MTRLKNCIERAAIRAGFGPEEAQSASLEILASPVIQTGPHCLLLIDPDAFYTHLFSLLGLKTYGRRWYINYCASTVSFVEAAKKGPGWLQLEGEPLNLFGLPRRRMDSHSICCPNGPHSFALTNSVGKGTPNASAVRLLEDLPSGEFPSAADAIKAANLVLWRRKFAAPVKLLQLDDFDIADLVADHLEDDRSWMSRQFIGDGGAAAFLLDGIDRLNAGPWAGWIRRTTDLFWRVEAHRVTSLRLKDNRLTSTGSSSFQVKFVSDDLARALRAREVLPSLFTVFLALSILPGARVLGGCRQVVYYPLMRYLSAIAFELSGNRGLLQEFRTDSRPGLWGHRVLKPAGGRPFEELEHAGGAASILSKYAQLLLTETSGDLERFRADEQWARLSKHLATGEISSSSDEWRWSKP